MALLCRKRLRDELTSLYMFCSLSFSSGFMALDTFSKVRRQISFFSPSVTILKNSTHRNFLDISKKYTSLNPPYHDCFITIHPIFVERFQFRPSDGLFLANVARNSQSSCNRSYSCFWKVTVSRHVVNSPVWLFAFVEVWFYNDCSTTVCFYGHQQTFVLFLAQPEKTKASRKSQMNQKPTKVRF